MNLRKNAFTAVLLLALLAAGGAYADEVVVSTIGITYTPSITTDMEGADIASCHGGVCVFGNVDPFYDNPIADVAQCYSAICLYGRAYDTCMDQDGDTYDGFDAVLCVSGTDCDDTDPSVNPGASETGFCDDGKDNDCDGYTDCDPNELSCVGDASCLCVDTDGDNYGAEGTITALCTGSPILPDCDDTDPLINPAGTELCQNLVDDDCDGDIDCADSDCAADTDCLGCVDADLDGYFEEGSCEGASDCDDSDAEINPAATEICDDAGDVDEDCDGAANCADLDCVGHAACPCVGCCDNDGDGYFGPAALCPEEDNPDCDDTVFEVNPGEAEICDNGIDDDCDTYPDCWDDDCENSVHCTSIPVIPNPTDTCIGGGDYDEDGYISVACEGGTDCDDSNPLVHPNAIEICGNGVDEDCDGRDTICPNVGMTVAPELALDLNYNGVEIPGDKRQVLVLDSRTGKAVESATFSVTPPGEEQIMMLTNRKGLAEFHLTTAGFYRVSASKGGYGAYLGGFIVGEIKPAYYETIEQGMEQTVALTFNGAPVEDALLKITSPAGGVSELDVPLGSVSFTPGMAGTYAVKIIRKDVAVGEFGFNVRPSMFSAEMWTEELGVEIFNPAKKEKPIPLAIVLIVALIAGQIVFYSVANRPVSNKKKYNSVLWGLAGFTVTLAAGLFMAAAAFAAGTVTVIIAWLVWKGRFAFPGFKEPAELPKPGAGLKPKPAEKPKPKRNKKK